MDLVQSEKQLAKTSKPLGSWRNKVTGIIYYNAYTQTRRYSKDKWVQSELFVDKSTDIQRNIGLQVNFFLPDVRDRFLEVSSSSQGSTRPDPSDEMILKSVVKIQRFYRAHRVRRTAQLPPRFRNTDRELEPLPSHYPSQDFVILNRTWPRTRTDFELLYNLLDRWRIDETKRMAEQLFEPARVALSSLILSKEVELLRAIEAMRTSVKLDRKWKTCRKLLDELSRPVLWKNSRSETVQVDTLRVQLARSFRDTFDKLSKEKASIEDRLETLSEVRKNIESHTCKTSDELIRLIDQETNLLIRGVVQSKLKWLRARLNITFLEIARNVLRTDLQNLRKDSFNSYSRKICKSCNRLLPPEKFPKETKHRSTCCNHCLYMKARSSARIVYSQYESMLRNVRRHELKLRSYNSLAFAVDEKFVYSLVNDVWHGKSGISEDDRLERLRLVRFRRNEEWSPWNCLLLTAKEASLHSKVDDLEKFYGEMMLQKFHTKNLQAKVLLRFAV